MQPLIHAALARAHADEIARRVARKAAVQPSEGPRPSRRAQAVERHAYASPRVTEVPHWIPPETFDESVW
jgi:transcriptional regulator GlxA family with amidase domain